MSTNTSIFIFVTWTGFIIYKYLNPDSDYKLYEMGILWCVFILRDIANNQRVIITGLKATYNKLGDK